MLQVDGMKVQPWYKFGLPEVGLTNDSQRTKLPALSCNSSEVSAPISLFYFKKSMAGPLFLSSKISMDHNSNSKKKISLPLPAPHFPPLSFPTSSPT
jgi:hypothetical protein